MNKPFSHLEAAKVPTYAVLDGQTSASNLIDRAKRLSGKHDLCRQDQNDLDILSERLIAGDSELVESLQGDRDGSLAVIQVLFRFERKRALFSFLSQLEIPRDDPELLNAAIGLGLGGDAASTHRWMVDYDVVGQRLEMIRTVILPYLAASCPQKTLFRALKQHEAEALAHKRPLLDPVTLHDLIGAVRSGTAPSYAEPFASTKTGGRFRLPLPNESFGALLRLAWTGQDYVFDLQERHGPEELVALLRTLHTVVPVCLIPTHLGYPMGGGESFMHQTCRILSEFGVRCVWVSFIDPKDGWYTQETATQTPYYLDIRYAGGCSKEAILRAVDEFNPDLIHAHGGTNDVVMEIAEETRLTTMAGYHFWSGLVDLGETSNQHILEHLAEHKILPSSSKSSRLIWKYVASEFMHEVYSRLGGTENLNVLHPISDAAQFLAPRDDSGIYVLQVNTCTLKGGNIFLDCVKALGDAIPFMGIETEPEASDFPARLAEEVGCHPLCCMRSYGNVREFYRTARMVIVPTLVDETFCRVAYEAAMNGIPVLSTANGYLPYMFGETGLFLPESSAEWIETVRQLYHDEERLKKIGDAQRARLQEMFAGDFRGFVDAAMRLLDSSATRNVGIFTAWGDQGIGNMSHAYATLLRRIGYRVHVFSFQPYAAAGKALVSQNDPRDWSAPANADSVYYSFNSREEVTVHELTQFILANDIHTLLVPEICWNPNWERLFAINVTKLAICSIPMIEIVIRDEIPNHNRLHTTLYCTRWAERVLNEAGISNGAFLGHGFGQPLPPIRVEQKRRRLASRPKIRFLHIAGHNPTTRKNTPQVIASFAAALAVREDIELTVTSMDPVSTYHPGEIPSGITVLDRKLSRDEILDLYEQHDVSIQVSSHEGLGLGFYESISRCTPVLSLDAPPHNEIVLQNETGWLIPAEPKPTPDNDRSVVTAWQFETSELVERLKTLGRDEIDRVIATTERTFRTRFDEVALLTRLLQTLRREMPRTVVAASVEELTAASPAAPPEPNEQTPSTLPMLGSRHLLRGKLYKLARWCYRLAKPVTRRIAYRLRLVMSDATADLRQELAALRNDMHALQHEFRHVADRQIKNSAAIQHGFRSVADRQVETSANLSRSLQDMAMEVRTGQASLTRVEYEARFIKARMASYAGAEAVLTYLPDESPIFVNTGDLGCPSPIINGGRWEPENLDVLYSFVRSETVFLDIGANVGFFAIAIANRLGQGGRVLAFEPHRHLTNLLDRSIQLNSLELVIEVRQCAVSSHSGPLELFYPKGHLGKGSSTRNASEEGERFSVQAYALDELLPQDLAVDLVKIDVEGHELSVLQGMSNVLARSPEIKVLFEKLERDGREAEAIYAIFADYGLDLYGIGPHAVLVPLDRNAYRGWVGDILAAPSCAVDRLSRTGFSIYPGQLAGTRQDVGSKARFCARPNGVVFFGPDWYLGQGRWKVTLHGDVPGPIRLLILEQDELVVAEMQFSRSAPVGSFEVDHDIARFGMRAYTDPGATVDLERVEFERV